MKFSETDMPDRREMAALYNAVGWTAYTNDSDQLEKAIRNSTYVVTARHQGELTGLARAVSDDVSIFYLQDVLVHPDHRGKGVGRHLIELCLERFADVRQKVLLTDDSERLHSLYESFGYRPLPTLDGLHGFVRIEKSE